MSYAIAWYLCYAGDVWIAPEPSAESKWTSSKWLSKVPVDFLQLNQFWCLFSVVLKRHSLFNRFVPNAPFLYPQKNKRFSDVFKGYRKGALGTTGWSIPHYYFSSFSQGIYVEELCAIFLDKYVNHVWKCYQTFHSLGKYRDLFGTL